MTAPLKKLVVNGKYLIATPTGVHRVATELANALADLAAEGHPAVRGVAMSTWMPRHRGRARDELRLPARVIEGPGGNLWEQLVLPFKLRHALLLNLCNIGPLASRRAVTMIHDAQVHITPQSYPAYFRLWYRFAQPVLASRHRKILTVSEHSRRAIAAAGICPAEKIAVIHNGVDHILRVTSSPAAFDRLALAPRGYVLGFANLQAHKNIGVVLRAFAHASLAPLKLVLVGAATASDFRRADMPLGGNVVLAGRVSDGELRGLMERALCLAFPSTTEGFGLPPLEAMLLGCPAIVAPCGALPEICGEAVRYAEADDPHAWAREIAALAGSAETRARLVDAGRVHAARFTWRKAALRLIEELRPLL